MSIYFNMKELSRSIVFKRIKSFPEHRKKRLLLIQQKLLYNNNNNNNNLFRKRNIKI